MLCSQNVKKYNKHKHTFSGKPPPTTWQLPYKPLDLVIILKKPSKWSFVFETSNYFGEYCCECDRTPLNFFISKQNHSQEYPYSIKGSNNFLCHYIYNLAPSHMTAYILTFICWIGFGGIRISLNPAPT